MRHPAIGLVLFALLAGAGCGDRKREGLPPSDEWKAPPGSDAAVAAVPETIEESLARCAARSFVADAVRDGNLPTAILDGLAEVPDARAVVLLRALVTAASRLPRGDQQAMLVATATQLLIEHGDSERAQVSLQRVATLLDRPADSEFRPEIAAAAAARAWGKLGDADAVKRLSGDPQVAPHLARGLAEGGHDALAADVLGRIAMLSRVDPFASAELAITDLIRGRADVARARVARAPADWRAVHALLLATAAVERKHPEARALVAAAAAEADRDGVVPPHMALTLAHLALTVGDAEGATARRAQLRRDLAANPDRQAALTGLYGLHVAAVEAGRTDEAATVLADMETRGAAPWAFTLARGVGQARAGELQRAIEDVARLPADAAPPRGVVHLEVLIQYAARAQRDPELERWLLDRVCAGDPLVIGGAGE